MQGVQGADLLTGSEGRLKGLQAEQVHVSMGDGRPHSGMGVTLICCKGKCKILGAGFTEASGNFRKDAVGFYGKPGRSS